MGADGWAPGMIVAGRFRLEERLGAGGMGEVFRAVELGSGRVVALKTLLKHADDDVRARFAREGQAQARVGAHPNVVQVHASGEDGGRAWLAMSLCPGGDLAGRLRRGPLPWPEAAALARDLALGLAHVHAQGVLHRDLKPANVLFDEDGRARLVDFGLARVEGQGGLTRTGALVGTPAFMAPEQVDGGACDARTDVLGLGATLYACLTGRPPFDRGSVVATIRAVLDDVPPPPSSIAPAVPAALDALVLRCLQKEPARRPQDARAVAAELDAILAGGAPRRGRATIGALATLLVAATAVAAVALRGTSTEAPPSTEAPVAPQPPPPSPTAPPSPEGDLDLGRAAGIRIVGRQISDGTPSTHFTLGRTAGWDPAGRVVLVTLAGDAPAVWTLDPSQATWRQVRVDGPLPPARTEASAAVDAARRRVVLFGGRVRGEGPIDDGVWELPLDAPPPARWRQVHPPARPPRGPRSRFGHSMAWDGQRVVVLGGRTGRGILGDIWAWDGTAWTAVSNGLPRASAALARGPDGRLWLFGGATTEGNTADLSPADGGVGPPEPDGPSGRYAAGLAWTGQRALLFGGRVEPAPGGGLDDTWIRTPDRWLRVERLDAWPAVRGSPALVAAPDGRLFLVGGTGQGGESTGTWSLRLVD